MTIQGVRTSIPQVAGTLKKFRNQINAQTQRQAQSVKVQIKRLVNFRG